MLSDKTAVRDLLEISKQYSANHIIFSPGSRNAPLILSFANDSFFDCISIPDERSAAFFALGIAQQTKVPTILSCTSGSALLNYSPAIVEAYYQKIPLIIVSADRPTEWTDQGDSQTIRQNGIYENYIKSSYELVQESDNDNDRWYNRRMISEAFEQCQNEIPGPVHINIPLREPLYNFADAELAERKIIQKLKTVNKLPEKEIEKLVTEWNSYSKKLIICGQFSHTNKLNPQIKKLLNDPSVAILTETTSNLYDERINPCIDRVITTFSNEDERLFGPDLVISMGEAIISKKIKALMRRLKPKAHWRIGYDYVFVDVFKSLTNQISVDPAYLIENLAPKIKALASGYQELWTERTKKTREKHFEFLESCSWCDLKAFDIILDNIPQNSHLHMGNSSPVRYVQLFDGREDIHYHSNRGVSGIDGCSSTAAGASYANNELHTLITGDVSFLYDSNAMWNKHLRSNLKIIVINNQGGGIFRIIPGPEESNLLEDYFECHHPVNLKLLVGSFGLDYFHSSGIEDLKSGIKKLYDSNKPAVLELTTPVLENDKILKEYFSFIKE